MQLDNQILCQRAAVRAEKAFVAQAANNANDERPKQMCIDYSNLPKNSGLILPMVSYIRGPSVLLPLGAATLDLASLQQQFHSVNKNQIQFYLSSGR
jgi:hypothetical protein